MAARTLRPCIAGPDESLRQGVSHDADAGDDGLKRFGFIGGGIINHDHLKRGFVLGKQERAERQIGESHVVMRRDDDGDIGFGRGAEVERFEDDIFRARLKALQGVVEVGEVELLVRRVFQKRFEGCVSAWRLWQQLWRKGGGGFALHHVWRRDRIGHQVVGLIQGQRA